MASSAAIQGDPKVVNFNVQVKDGIDAAAKVLYNISACDGNVIVIDKYLMPCKVRLPALPDSPASRPW